MWEHGDLLKIIEGNMLISFSQANNVLLPYMPELCSLIHGAWNDYQVQISSNVQAILSTRSRASIVHDFMVKRAIEFAEGKNNVSFIRRKRMFVLIFKSEYGFLALRFKKRDKGGFSQNIPTKQVSDFKNQIPIHGIDVKHHLEIGYILTDMQDVISSIVMVCPSGGAIYWMAEITPAGSRENVVNLWEHKGEEEQSGDGFVVRPRKVDDNDKDATTDSN